MITDSSLDTRAGGAIRVLDLQEIQALATPAIALAAARRAFEALATGAVSQPTPMGWDVAGGDMHVKGAWLKGSPIFALKAATGFAANRERGLPTSSGFVMIFDAATGQSRALLADDGYLTELRTGAAGALAVSLLAVPRAAKIAMMTAALGGVLTTRNAGRESSTERIVCDLTGTGAQDAAMAEAVWTAYLSKDPSKRER